MSAANVLPSAPEDRETPTLALAIAKYESHQVQSVLRDMQHYEPRKKSIRLPNVNEPKVGNPMLKRFARKSSKNSENKIAAQKAALN